MTALVLVTSVTRILEIVSGVEPPPPSAETLTVIVLAVVPPVPTQVNAKVLAELATNGPTLVEPVKPLSPVQSPLAVHAVASVTVQAKSMAVVELTVTAPV